MAVRTVYSIAGTCLFKLLGFFFFGRPALKLKIPGIHIPEWMIQRIANADDVKEVSIQLAAELISELAPLCGGVHLMALGAEDRIPLILDRAMT